MLFVTIPNTKQKQTVVEKAVFILNRMISEEMQNSNVIASSGHTSPTKCGADRHSQTNSQCFSSTRA